MTESFWIEFKVKVPFEYVEPVAELFKKYGKDGLVIEHEGGWNPDEGESPPESPSAILRTYIPQTPAFKTNQEMLHIGLQLIGKLTELEHFEERKNGRREGMLRACMLLTVVYSVLLLLLRAGRQQG